LYQFDTPDSNWQPPCSRFDPSGAWAGTWNMKNTSRCQKEHANKFMRKRETKHQSHS